MAIICFERRPKGAELKPGEWINNRDGWTSETNDCVCWKEWEGLCISDREANHYHDSDFFMTVWDPTTQSAKEIEFASTRCWSYPAYGSAVDASPGIVARYQQWLEERARITIALCDPRKAVVVGATVRVKRGRKVPKGTVGKVLTKEREVAHKSRYGTWTTYRDMLLIDCGNAFWQVNADNCEVVEPSPQLIQKIFDMAEAA